MFVGINKNSLNFQPRQKENLHIVSKIFPITFKNCRKLKFHKNIGLFILNQSYTKKLWIQKI